MKEFLIAGGSVPGTDHTKPGQPGWINNQDAFVWRLSENYLVAVVCDGCGSTPHPEVGANIGANLVARHLLSGVMEAPGNGIERIERGLKFALDLTSVKIADIASQMGGSLGQALADYFLFTIMGVVMTPDVTAIFSFGDGVFAANGQLTIIPPYPNNAPPYLAYAQMPSVRYPGGLEFTIRSVTPTEEIDSVLIGSDGVADFVEKAESALPGKNELLGPIEQFWIDDKFVKNSDMIRRRLALANREWFGGGIIRKGLLHDDTTLVVIRRDNALGETP